VTDRQPPETVEQQVDLHGTCSGRTVDAGTRRCNRAGARLTARTCSAGKSRRAGR
jgi:hypothetical protein